MAQKRVLVAKMLRIAILAMLLVNAVQPGWRAARAQAAPGPDLQVGAPVFALYLNEKEVRGAGWPDGALLTLTVDDPATADIEYSAQQTANAVSGSDPQVVFSLGSLTPGPGLNVTLSDGVTVKTLVTSALVITNVDQAADTISGTAEPGSLLDVGPLCNAHCAIRHVVTNGDGTWTADFGQPGSAADEQDLFDIRPGDGSAVHLVDADGDSSARTWRLANPRLIVLPQANEVKGDDWPAGISISLTVDDPNTGPETDFQADIQPIGQPGQPASFDYKLQGYTISPGDKVTVTNTAYIRSTSVSQLKITRVDTIQDTVAGTAAPGAVVAVSIDQPGGAVRRQVTANPGNGSWKADFSSPGEQPGETETVDILPGSSGWANEYDPEDNSTQVAWRAAQPTVRALLTEDEIQTMDWPLGSPVNLTITSAENSDNSIYSDTQTAVSSPWNPAETWVDFRISGMTMQPGMTIHLTDGATLKTHRLQALAVTWVDIDRNTISGRAEPNARVEVLPVCGSPGQCATRSVKADQNGLWQADFSRPGQGQEERATLDFVAGMRGEAQIAGDTDGDTVVDTWQALDPTITAYPQSDQVSGENWPADGPTLLTINDPATADAVDFQASVYGEPDPNNPAAARVSFDLGGYDLKAGDQVTLTNGPASRSMTVSPVQVTSANPSKDTVEGTTGAGGSIQVWADRSNGSIYRSTQADNSGKWKVDFNTAGPDEQLYDIHPGESGQARETGEDGGSTQIAWYASSPHIEVRPAEGVLIAREWPEGATLSITVDPLDTDTPEATYSLTAALPDQGNTTEARLTLDNPLHPGDFISVSGAGISREITLTALTITGVDRRANAVSGMAEPNTSVYAELADQPSCNQWTIADGAGRWTASFAGLEDACIIRSGMEIQARQSDADDDATVATTRAPVPYLTAETNSGRIEARDWPLGESISLTITDPEQSGAYTAHKNTRRETDSGASVAVFSLNNYHLKAGQTITVSDGVDTKTLVIATLTAKVDPKTNQVTGITRPGQQVFVWVDGPDGQRSRALTANSSGSYTADFSIAQNGGAADITFDTTGGVIAADEDMDRTSLTWRVPNPTVHVAPEYPEVHGHGDWSGDTVTLIVDDDPDPLDDAPLYRVQRSTEENPWCGEPCFDLRSAGITLQPGQYVTLTDGLLTKTLVVGNLYITRVDIAKDVIRGATDPGAQVVVGINNGDGLTRTVTADASGTWRADFSQPGTLDSEEKTADIIDGDSGWALLAAPGSPEDGTLAYWDAIQAECTPGKSISGQVVKTGKWRGADSNIHAPVKITITDYQTGKLVARAIAKPDGSYGCSLPAGTYRVFAETDGYSTEYYDNRPNEAATPVTVANGETETNINFTFDTPAFVYTHLDFNFARPLTADAAIRLAIARAINREKLIADQMPSSPVLDSILPSGDPRYPGTDSGLPHYTYNPTEAKRLLEEAGWVDSDGDGVREKNDAHLRLTLIVVNQPRQRSAAARVQADLAAVGIDVTIRSYQANGEFFGTDGALASGDFDLALFAWKFGLNAEYSGYLYHQNEEPNYIFNYGKYASSTADALLDQADARTSYAARVPYYQQHQVVIMKDLATLPLFWHIISDSDLDGVDDRHDPCPLDAQDACGGL